MQETQSIAAEAAAYWIDGSFGRRDTPVAREDDGAVHRLRVEVPGAPFVEIALPCMPGEHIVGLGEQFTQLDKRGRVIDGWLGATVNAAAPHTYGLDGGYKLAPWWYSSAGYAALSFTTLRFRLDLGVANPTEVCMRVPGGTLELIVIDGTPLAAVKVATAMAGRSPLAPPWVYGAWRSARGGHEEVVANARRSREEGLPASAT